jgi:hypothetical protein
MRYVWMIQKYIQSKKKGGERMNKQERHDELVANDENLTDEELAEKTQLYYELHPEVFRQLVTDESKQPSDVNWYTLR